MRKKEETARQKMVKILWKYIWKVFKTITDSKSNEYHLMKLLPKSEYYRVEGEMEEEDLVEIIKKNSAYEFLGNFSDYALFDMCLSYSDIFDQLSDERLGKILNRGYKDYYVEVDRLFSIFDENNDKDRVRQFRILKLLNVSFIGNWFYTERFLQINDFLVWLKMAEIKGLLNREETSKIFQKIASISMEAMAKVLSEDELERGVVERILEDVPLENYADICRQITPSKLLETIKRSNLSLVNNCYSKEIFTVVYRMLPDEDKKTFFDLMDEKMDGFFSKVESEILTEHYLSLGEDEKMLFMKKLFSQNFSVVEAFLDMLSLGNKIEVFEFLKEDKMMRAKLIQILKEKNNLSWGEEVFLKALVAD